MLLNIDFIEPACAYHHKPVLLICFQIEILQGVRVGAFPQDVIFHGHTPLIEQGQGHGSALIDLDILIPDLTRYAERVLKPIDVANKGNERELIMRIRGRVVLQEDVAEKSGYTDPANNG